MGTLGVSRLILSTTTMKSATLALLLASAIPCLGSCSLLGFSGDGKESENVAIGITADGLLDENVATFEYQTQAATPAQNEILISILEERVLLLPGVTECRSASSSNQITLQVTVVAGPDRPRVFGELRTLAPVFKEELAELQAGSGNSSDAY